MAKPWKFLAISVLAVVCLGLALGSGVPGAIPQALADTNEWAFEIQDETVTKVPISTSFTVNITAVQWSTENSDGWEAYLRYNTTYLNVTGIDIPATLPPPNNGAPDKYPAPGIYDMANPGYNNTEGILYVGYSPAPMSPKLNETFWLATIHFDAKAVEGTSYLNFVNVDMFHTTKILLGSIEVQNWSKFVNGTVMIGDFFNLTVTSDGCCPITVGGLGTVAANSNGTFMVPCPSVTLTANDTASACNFTNWTVDGGAPTTSNPIIVNGTANSSHTAIARCAAVAAAALEGHVSFPMARVGGLGEPFEVKLFGAGNLSHVIWTGNATTNSSGVFNITGLDPGTYDIGIKNATCVSELVSNVTLTAGETEVVNFTIREGDVHSDDYVDMVDYGDFSYAYETLPGDDKWNANADLDRNGFIDMGDYSMFSYNYEEQGDAYGCF